jgi:ABC-type molybdate transport system substrate-binding protein
MQFDRLDPGELISLMLAALAGGALYANIANTRFNLLGNQLVLIAPKDSKLDSVAIGPNFDLAKLAGDGSIAVGDVRQVPVGMYAKAALEKLGA